MVLRRDTPYRQHGTCYAKHLWSRVRPEEVGIGDTIVAAAGLGTVVAVNEMTTLIEFSVAGRKGNSRASGSPLTFYRVEDVYLHDDKRCKCKEDDDD